MPSIKESFISVLKMTQSEFTSLLAHTRHAFDQSPIKTYAEKEGHTWNYSICATPLKAGQLMLIGFNWGASSGGSYEPQYEIPSRAFMQMDNKDLGSFKRVKRYLKQHFPLDLEGVGQSNFCFFRSAKDGQITEKDLELSTPLFEELIRIAPPKLILGFSSRLRTYLMGLDRFTVHLNEELPFERRGKVYRCIVVKGALSLAGQSIPVALLPHPNSPLRGAIRERAWELCAE